MLKCQNWTGRCKGEGTIRCSIIMKKGTPPGDAVFVEDGVAYGYTYYYCKRCFQRLSKARKAELKVWND